MLARLGGLDNIIGVTRTFDDGVRACVPMNDEKCPGWLDVEQGLRQRGLLDPILFDII